MVLSRRGFIGSMGVLQARPRQLAQDFVAVFSSDDPSTRVAYSPGIETLGNGRLIATMDLGLVVGGKKLEMKGGIPANRDNWLGRVFTSDDRGRSWTERGRFPARHARPFRCGRSVYILGHSDDLVVLRSDDGGIKWSEPVTLTKGDFWHAAPCNVWRSGGSVSFVMEKVTDPSFKEWSVSVLAPVVLSAKEGADLTRRESWVFSNEVVFRDLEKARQVGVPFFKPGPQTPGKKDVRGNAPAGWLEFNTLQVMDPNDVWFDASGRTLHLMGRRIPERAGWLVWPRLCGVRTAGRSTLGSRKRHRASRCCMCRARRADEVPHAVGRRDAPLLAAGLGLRGLDDAPRPAAGGALQPAEQ